MTFKFYKDIQIIKWCTTCGIRFEPKRYTWRNKRSICIKCVAKEIAAWRKKNPQKWSEIVRKYRKKARGRGMLWVAHAYLKWREWATENPEKRRKIALRSYHKRKQLKKDRPPDT